MSTVFRLSVCLVLFAAACGDPTIEPPADPSPAPSGETSAEPSPGPSDGESAQPKSETPAPAQSGTVEVDGKTYRISGPYGHENLSVFLLHSDEQDNRDFITLDEGLENKWVTVTEKQSAQVSELLIENRSEKPLFLQEGDRLRGGKQDRIVGICMVIPPKSGEVPVRSFCIEQGRWAAGANGRAFGGSSLGLAPMRTRSAAKIDKDQGGVWRDVAEKKRVLYKSLGASNDTSSLNEAMDSEEVKKRSAEFRKVLEEAAEGRGDAVGAA
ncbi:MAG: ARPP-1 family domain-containing protein, partial [Planctomycetota bacterium]